MSDFNQQKYVNNYMKENYDTFKIQVPKGTKKEIELCYKAKGYKSMNAYINKLIKDDLYPPKKQLEDGEKSFILSKYEYGTEEDRKKLFKTAIEIDSMHTEEEKKRIFEQRMKEKKSQTNIQGGG